MDLKLLLIVAFGALGAYALIARIAARRALSAEARRVGADDAPTLPNGGFLGLNYLKAMLAADKNKQFPDLMLERQKKMCEVTGRECSTFKLSILGQQLYFTSDPKNIQAMLAVQFKDFSLGPQRRGIMMQTLGDGIFVQDNQAWEHSRGLLRPNFVRDQISDLDLEERHVQDLLRVMPVKSDGWTDLTDVQSLFFRLTLDSACEFLFGESLGVQLGEAGLSQNKTAKQIDRELAFSKNFDAAQLHMAHMFRLGDKYWVYRSKDFQKNNRIVNEFIAHYVDLALSKKQSEKASIEDKEKYVMLEELATQTRDPEALRGQLLNVLLAGRDTTASLLSWLFLMLLYNPSEFKKLRATVLETFGSYEEPTNLTFASLKGCQYLQFCLNETLRLWTVVPGNGRRSVRMTTLPRGGGPDGMSPVVLPKDTQVDYSIHVMHRRKDIWGEDAEEFKPERFRGLKSGWEFLPFNGGPRICIGQQFALTEASYVTVRLLQRFDKLEAAPGLLEGPILSNLGLTNCPARLVTLRAHVADSSKSE